MLKNFSKKIYLLQLGNFYLHSSHRVLSFDYQHLKPVKSWAFQVEPLWKLCAHVTSCDIKVESLSAHDNPNGDEMKVHLYQDASLVGGIGHTNQFKVSCDRQLKHVTITNDNTEKKSSFLHILLPIAFDIHLTLHANCSASVSNMECNSTIIKVEKGKTSVHNIKGRNIEINASEGDIKARKVLQGNLSLFTGYGSIFADKLQGPKLSLNSSKSGSISVKDIYAEELDICVEDGNICINSLHGNSNIQSSMGDIFVGTAEGNVKILAQAGNIDMHVMKTEVTELIAPTGKISLSTALELEADMDLKAKVLHHEKDAMLQIAEQYSIDKNIIHTIGFLNNGGPLIKATGDIIDLKTSSWWKRASTFVSVK